MISNLGALALLAAVLPLQHLRAAPLFPVVVGDRWGFIDKSGKLVINPQFERAGVFESGLAPARLGRWGYVNMSGKMQINPQFDEAAPFSEGLAAVALSRRFGNIGAGGKYVWNPGN